MSPQDTPAVPEVGAEDADNSLLRTPDQMDVDIEDADNSFLARPEPIITPDQTVTPSHDQMDVDVGPGEDAAPPSPEPEEELTFEKRVMDYGLDYGLGDRNGVHDERIHDLYADIAGISRHMRDPENPNHKYKPPYSNIGLDPHQSYPTAWLMDDSSRVLHYLADEPGLGKTFAACEAMVRITMILSNGIAIENERKQLPSLRERPLHVHEEASPYWPCNTVCRADTVSKWGFVCQCQKESPLYDDAYCGNFSEGFMLVMVPLHITGQWAQEIARFIRSSARLPHNNQPIEVINIHGLKGLSGENLKKFVWEERDHQGLGTICIVPTTSTVTSSLDSLRDAKAPEMPMQPSLICWDEIQRIKSVDHEAVLFVQELIDAAAHPVHVLALSGSAMSTGPSDFDVVESIALNERSFRGWYGDEVYDGYKGQLLEAKANLGEYAKQVIKSDIVGRGKKDAIPDGEKAEARELMTSYDQRCRKYALVVPLLQRKQWDNYLGYRIPKSLPETEHHIIRFNSSMNDVQKQVANNYKEYLRSRYRHRVNAWKRKAESTRGPRPKMREVLFELDSQAPIPNALNSRTSIIEASLIGFAPGLADAVLNRSTEDGSKEFRSAEVNDIFAKTTTGTQRNAVMKSPFWSEAKSAFQVVDEKTGQAHLHPKIETICKIIDEMLADKTPHADGKKNFGVFPKKAVIFVPHAWHGYILIAYLFTHYKNRNFTFVGSGSKPEEREALLAPFKRRTHVRDPADARSDDPIAVIGTYDILGTGLNLIRANYAIATSPLGSLADQKQAFARINRRGQYCKTHTYVLVDNGNPVDVTTFQRMQLRTALTVPQDEMGQGLDFLLENIDEVENEEDDEDAE